jgi:hypothetical protein
MNGSYTRAAARTDFLVALQMLWTLELLVAEFARGHTQAGTTPSHRVLLG